MDDFEHAHLHQRHQRADIVRDDVFMRTRALFDRDPAQGARRGVAGMLLIEARGAGTLRAAHEAQRPAGQVRQHRLRHRDIIFGKVALGEPLVRIQNAIGVRQRDPGHGISTLPLAARMG